MMFDVSTIGPQLVTPPQYLGTGESNNSLAAVYGGVVSALKTTQGPGEETGFFEAMFWPSTLKLMYISIAANINNLFVK